MNATTRRDPYNNVVGVVGVAQDVTESSKNDRAVAAMAHELRQLVDTANAPIFGEFFRIEIEILFFCMQLINLLKLHFSPGIDKFGNGKQF